MTDLTTKPNAELAYKVLDRIDAEPEHWNQRAWNCGSSFCFGGWAITLSGATLIADYGVVEVADGPPGLVGVQAEDAACTVLGLRSDAGAPGPGSAWIADHHGEGDDGWLFDPNHGRDELGRIVEAIFGPRPSTGGA